MEESHSTNYMFYLICCTFVGKDSPTLTFVNYFLQNSLLKLNSMSNNLYQKVLNIVHRLMFQPDTRSSGGSVTCFS